MRIAVLMTSFNRCQTTLKCLNNLFSQFGNYLFDVVLCDDNSTDGTKNAVTTQFPQVKICHGNGNLYWNRGMLKAWESAIDYFDYDAYLWLNDDVLLNNDCFEILLSAYNETKGTSIICGTFCNKAGAFTYGGKDRKFNPIKPNGRLQEIYYLNGNCVLVPKSAVDKIGLLDKIFIHHLGDYDYGLRALEAGIKVYSTPVYIGTCEANTVIGDRSRKNGVNIINRFKRLYSPLGYNPIIRYKYQARHFGVPMAIVNFIKIHINNLLPDSVYNWKNKKKYEYKSKCSHYDS